MEPTPTPTTPESTPPQMITVPPELAVPAPAAPEPAAAPEMITVPEEMKPAAVEPAPAPEVPVIPPAPGVEMPTVDTSAPVAGMTVPLTDTEVAGLNPASVSRMAESAASGAQTAEEAATLSGNVTEAYNSAVKAATENINAGAETTLAPEVEPPTTPEAPQA